MSIRQALVGGISVLLLIAIGVVALVGITTIRANVVREAQSRVDQALSTLSSLYETDLRLTAERLRLTLDRMEVAAGDPALATRLMQARRQLEFVVLNCVGPTGAPLGGTFGESVEGIEPESDPVIRTALRGEAAWATALLSPERLRAEGGEALVASQRLPRSPGSDAPAVNDALFQWFAVPLFDQRGQVVAVIYGGRPINYNTELIDDFAHVLFGDRQYEQKPVGTVTIFLLDTRAATNVRDAEGRRAMGTRVSEEVRRRVLVEGQRWRDRAWVVDAWYISGYEPLKDLAGQTIGMLYVGLLEAPYDALRTRLILRFVLPTLILLSLGLTATVWMVRRITRPVSRLRDGAASIGAGNWDAPISAGDSYREIAELADTFHRMQQAIQLRDRELTDSNRDLSATNDELARVNRSYMSTLGFVTHELKAPLANIQTQIDLVVDGYVGEMPEKGKQTLVRIKRNCEELQTMVKNYLDLSRAEREGIHPEPREIEFVADVVTPCIEQTEALFSSREIELEVAASPPLALQADAELLRIALTNYLSNAATYGREGGRARLQVVRDADSLQVEVWNEGAGFTESERAELFGKFRRLKNANTRSRKGSGLGLYLCSEVLGAHGGRVWAESEPGQWARFLFRLPLAPPAE